MVSGEFGVVEWTPGWEDNFDQLAGRLLVPPVVRSLLYSQVRLPRASDDDFSLVLSIYFYFSFHGHAMLSCLTREMLIHDTYIDAQFAITLLPGPGFGAPVGG